jgi:hypothetical protein
MARMSERSYVVRVYRSRRNEPKPSARRSYDQVLLDGIVEEPETGKRSSFHGVEELWRLLTRAPRRGARPAGGTS